MSKFFKALEQAKRDRTREEGDPSPVFAPPPIAPPREPVAPGARSTGERAADGPRKEPAREPPRIVEPRPSPISPERNGIDGHLVSLLAPTAFETEQYRNLRTFLEEKRTGQGYVVAVSSAAVGDGKTTTAINLAAVLAEDESARVLLADADLRNPSVARRLGIDESRSHGLVGALRSPALSLKEVVTTRPPFLLSILPAGRSVTSPYEMLKSPRFGELLDEARRNFDYVVLDTPPVVSLSDCRLIGNWVDGFLIVVSAHRTPRKLVEEALNVLEPSKVVGFVFNNDSRSWAAYGYYHYGHASVSSERLTPTGA